MAELKIYGASDDLLELEGAIEEELSAWVNGDSYKGKIEIKDKGRLINVYVFYDGNWSFAVSTDVDFSEWMPTVRRECPAGRGYSELLVIEVEDPTFEYKRP